MAIDLNGWDLVAGITYEDVNLAISRDKTSPTDFAVSSSDGTASVSDGKFGTWSLVRGSELKISAAGDTITVNIPVTGGTLRVAGTSGALVACDVTATIHAEYIPQPGGDALMPSMRSAEVVDSKPDQSDFTRQAGFRQLMTQWLQENLKTFNQVFATVNLEADFSQTPGLAWMKPTYHGYATAEPAQVGSEAPKNVFAVLALIDGGKPTTRTVNTVSEEVIPTLPAKKGETPKQADAGVCISAGKFLEHFMLDGASWMFDGRPNPKTSFRIDNDELEIVTTTELNLPKLSLENGNEVSPTVPSGAFSIQVVGTELKINLDEANFVPKTLFHASVNYNGVYNIAYDATKQILTLVDVSHTSGGSCAADHGLNVLDIALGVTALCTGMIAGAAGGVRTSATNAITAAGDAAQIAPAAAGGVQNAQAAAAATISCCWGLINGTVESFENLAAQLKATAWIAGIAACGSGIATAGLTIAKFIIENEFSQAPKLDAVTGAAVGNVVKWPASIGTYKLASAQLNGCLQFGLTKSA
jgi:hypothetical protein